MGKSSFLERIKYSLIQPNYPEVGIEFNTDCIRVAAVDISGGKIQVTHLDSEPLAPGAMEITPFKANIIHLEPVADALRALWSRNKEKDSNVCLLLQDRAALAFNVVLEAAASNQQQFQDLVRFKLKKNVPFRIEDSQLSFFNPFGTPEASGTNIWVTVMHHQILQQYERFLESTIGVQSGLVDLVTFNAMNLAHEEMKRANLLQQDVLYVNLNLDYVSTAITQKGSLTFYRNRALEKQNGILEEALTEIHPATMYYVDKLSGQNLSAVFVYSPDYAEDLCARIQQELSLNASVLTIDPFTGTRFDATNAKTFRNFAPLVGLLISRKVEFV